MATTIVISTPGGSGEAVVWPEQCVGCGATPITASNLVVEKLVSRQSGEQRPVRLTLAVPHCGACARSTKAVFLAQLLPFALGFLVAGAAGLAAGFYGGHVLGVDEAQMRSGATPYSLVLAGAVGLLGGIAGGFAFELLGRVLLLPIYGRALWKAPMLVPTFFTDVDYVAGLAARPNADASQVALTFDRDDVAREFAERNR